MTSSIQHVCRNLREKELNPTCQAWAQSESRVFELEQLAPPWLDIKFGRGAKAMLFSFCQSVNRVFYLKSV